MNPIHKSLVATCILAVSVALAFGVPKTKYQGTDIISSLNLPHTMPGWSSEDISDEIKQNGQSMNFLGHVLVREYDKDNGPLLYLFILDANNFHHPKTCVGGAGFDAQDLKDIEFKLPYHTLKAKAIYFQKQDEGFLTVYWICINKKQVDWTNQKLTQLWYSLFNKQKPGIMVRIDITAPKDQIAQASQTIQELLTDLSAQIPPEEQEYLFGK
ncbi:MAG: exosortase-associated EpsI family protein [Candidatus Omnitrophica bacterium]|nr:exosortase-associated EpsI family protein [Candidatus Omnitrophota bacterium]